MNDQTETEAQTRSRRSAIGGLMIISGLGAGGFVFNREVIQPKKEARLRLEAEREAAEEARQEALKQARKTVEEHLSNSEETTAGHIETRVSDIERFFNKAQRGVPAFSEEMFGLESKWKLIKDKVQFWKEEGEHQEFVKEKFAEHVFLATELEKVIQTSVEDFVSRDGEAVNNQFLTAVRENVPIDLLDSDADPGRFQKVVRKSVDQNFTTSINKVYKDAAQDTGMLVGSILAEGIGQKVLARIGATVSANMGVSLRVMGAGAAAALQTRGLSLLVATVIVMALSWAIDYFADPEGDLTQSIRFELAKLERIIIEGTPATKTESLVFGVRGELETIAGLQSWSRREAMDSIFDPSTT